MTTRSFVYILSSQTCFEQGIFKIGMTTNPFQRYLKYQTTSIPGTPWKYYLLLEILNPDMVRPIETYFLNMFPLCQDQELDPDVLTGTEFRYFPYSLSEIRDHIQEILAQENPDFEYQIYKMPNFRNFNTESKDDDIILSSEIRPRQPAQDRLLPNKIAQILTYLGYQEWNRYQLQALERFDREYPTMDSYRKIIRIPTGCGKAALGLGILSLMRRHEHRKLTFLWITNQNAILSTQTETFTDWTRGEKIICTKIYGNRNHHDRIHTGHRSSIILTNQQTLMNIADNMPQIDGIVYDEVQYAASAQFHEVLLNIMERCGTKLLIGMSATPLTMDHDQEARLSRLFPLELGRELIDIDMPMAIDDGIIAQPMFYYNFVSNERSEENLDFIWTVILRHVREFQPFRHDEYCRWIFFVKDCNDVDRMWVKGVEYCEMLNIRVLRTHSNLNQKDEGRILANNLSQKPSTQHEIIIACNQLRVGVDVAGLAGAFLSRCEIPQGHLLTQMLGRTLRNREKDRARFVVFMQNDEELQEYYLRFSIGFFRSLSDWLHTDVIHAGQDPHEIEDLAQKVVLTLGQGDQSEEEMMENMEKLKRNVIRRMCQMSTILPYFKFLAVLRTIRIRTSEAYREYCRSLGPDTGLPLQPSNLYRRNGWPGWYSYFHPDVEKKTLEDMYGAIQQNKLYSILKYERWQLSNPGYPTLNDIKDEYFVNITTFRSFIIRSDII